MERKFTKNEYAQRLGVGTNCLKPHPLGEGRFTPEMVQGFLDGFEDRKPEVIERCGGEVRMALWSFFFNLLCEHIVQNTPADWNDGDFYTAVSEMSLAYTNAVLSVMDDRLAELFSSQGE